MVKEEEYEYHKQNEYPGERIAERERVADRREAADKRSDARVAKRDKMHDKHMDSEIRRSSKKAARVNRKRDALDNVGLAVIIALSVIILVGVAWVFMAMQKQSDEINRQSKEIESLKVTVADAKAEVIPYDDVRLSDEDKQVQLYKDFVVLGNNVKEEISALEDYNMIYSDMYQLCSGFTERENSINHALYRFAEKEIVYYEQIAVLANKPECEAKIETMRSAMNKSKAADEELYVLTKNLCDEITDNVISYNTKLKIGWETARAEAETKAKAFDNAEKSVIECFN